MPILHYGGEAVSLELLDDVGKVIFGVFLGSFEVADIRVEHLILELREREHLFYVESRFGTELVHTQVIHQVVLARLHTERGSKGLGHVLHEK